MKKYLLRHSKIRNENLKYDFLPPMLEVLEHPSNPVGGLLVLGIFLLLVSTVIWAAFFRLDVVVTAPGNMAPRDNLVLVQAQSGGPVKDIKVRDGDTVDTGDVIMELDKRELEMNMEELQYQRELLETQKEIYEKIYNDTGESSGEDSPGDLPEEMEADSHGDFGTVVRGILEEQKLYLSQVKEYEVQIQAAEGENKKITRAALESYQIQRQMELLQNISNLEVQLAGNEKDMEQVLKRLEEADITAPAPGTISQLQVSHPGEMVSASQGVGYILPQGAEMVFKCYVPNGDITHIELGQTVAVKLDAYPYSRYGTMEGVVDYIDGLAVNVEGMGTAYAVFVVLEPGEDIDCRVGLGGSCDIRVSDRTVLEYFLEPIQKGFGESLDEL